MQGPVFIDDSKTVCGILLKAVPGDLAFKWIKALDNSMDGRLAIETLMAHFEGDGAIAVNANNILEDLYYKGKKIFSFENYVAQLKRLVLIRMSLASQKFTL